MKIIPAIDIIEGKCVRLEQGNYQKKKIYNENPLDVALEFQDHGIKYLHLVDLDGAKSNEVVNYSVLEKIASKTNLEIDFGGGVKTDQALQQVLDSGAKYVSVGSLAVKEPQKFFKWMDKISAERLILSADVREGKISVNGWLEDSELELIDFIQTFVEKGLRYTTITDISKDGMLTGPNFDLYKEVKNTYKNLKTIVSGGVSSIEDLDELEMQGTYGVILGKAIYEGRITLKQLEKFN